MKQLGDKLVDSPFVIVTHVMNQNLKRKMEL